MRCVCVCSVPTGTEKGKHKNRIFFFLMNMTDRFAHFVRFFVMHWQQNDKVKKKGRKIYMIKQNRKYNMNEQRTYRRENNLVFLLTSSHPHFISIEILQETLVRRVRCRSEDILHSYLVLHVPSKNKQVVRPYFTSNGFAPAQTVKCCIVQQTNGQ